MIDDETSTLANCEVLLANGSLNLIAEALLMAVSAAVNDALLTAYWLGYTEGFVTYIDVKVVPPPGVVDLNTICEGHEELLGGNPCSSDLLTFVVIGGPEDVVYFVIQVVFSVGVCCMLLTIRPSSPQVLYTSSMVYLPG